MDASSVLSDDLSDYDVISNPALESSILLTPLAKTNEPPLLPSQVARDYFPIASLPAESIQLYVQRALNHFPSSDNGNMATVVRVYVDGVFEQFSVRHALQLRQAKLSFPHVHLMVGVFDDNLVTSSVAHAQRCEVLRHCRWVDEVYAFAPLQIDESLLRRLRIDYVALEEGISVDPECSDKLRLKGYDDMKSLRKVIPTRKVHVPTVPPTVSADESTTE